MIKDGLISAILMKLRGKELDDVIILIIMWI